MKRVHVQYFAMLREQARCAEESVATSAGTPAALYRELAGRHGFTLPPERARVALDGEFAAWDAPLRDGVRLAFIPPFAGG
ncbi:MAG TPA: MoaD/ThiS family protein [Opitutaceae bacterium]|nr:MoaD/ThiS family protein [Opitutaceae bacterium]